MGKFLKKVLLIIIVLLFIKIVKLIYIIFNIWLIILLLLVIILRIALKFEFFKYILILWKILRFFINKVLKPHISILFFFWFFTNFLNFHELILINMIIFITKSQFYFISNILFMVINSKTTSKTHRYFEITNTFGVINFIQNVEIIFEFMFFFRIVL